MGANYTHEVASTPYPLLCVHKKGLEKPCGVSQRYLNLHLVRLSRDKPFMVSQDGTIGLRSEMRPNGERCLAVGDAAAYSFEAGEVGFIPAGRHGPSAQSR